MESGRGGLAQFPLSAKTLAVLAQGLYSIGSMDMPHSKYVLTALVALSVWCAAPSLPAGQPPAWPQFRGPGGSGVAEAEAPPVDLGPETNVRWKVSVPGGASSPVIVGDLLVLTAFEENQLLTIAYRRNDGAQVWRASAPYEQLEPFHPTEGSPAASTPVTDGERIVTYFGSCGLFCYDLAGHELWSYRLPPAATVADFGTGVSPVLTDGLVVLLRDEHHQPEILAVEIATGRLKWKRKRESVSGFGTPVIWDTPSGKQIAAPGYGRMIGYDLHTGEEVWSVEGMPSACCTTPVVADGQLFFAGWSPGDASEKGGFKMPTFDDVLAKDNADANGDGMLSKAEAANTMLKNFFDNNDPNKDGQITRQEWDQMLEFMARCKNSAFALKPGGRGDVTQSHVLWQQTGGLPYVPSAIVYRGEYVMVKDGGIVTAYDARSGKETFQKRAAAPGEYYASPVAADGHLYFTSLKEGIVTVLKAGDAGYELVKKNPPLGERVCATPAIADNTIFIRTAAHLYAFAKP